jgi:hypothetical protein
VLLIWGAFKFSDRVRNWERGAPDRRPTTKKNVKNRLRDFRAGAYMQTLLRDRYMAPKGERPRQYPATQ